MGNLEVLIFPCLWYYLGLFPSDTSLFYTSVSYYVKHLNSMVSDLPSRAVIILLLHRLRHADTYLNASPNTCMHCSPCIEWEPMSTLLLTLEDRGVDADMFLKLLNLKVNCNFYKKCGRLTLASPNVHLFRIYLLNLLTSPFTTSRLQ